MGMLGVTLAVLATAIGGGTYKGGVEGPEPCGANCPAVISVADDGRSLTRPSVIATPCGARWRLGAPRGTPIGASGRFQWRTDSQTVAGRFSPDGRSVSGTVRPARSEGCGDVSWPFSARLKRRALHDGVCEPQWRGSLWVSVFVRPRGCTAATRVADAWRADRACVTRTVRFRACRVAGWHCAPVLGGHFEPLAGVACGAGRSRIELVIERSCHTPGSLLLVRVTNAGCGEARRVIARWQRRRECGLHACTVAGWRCRRSAPPGPGVRCRRPHRAIQSFEIPIVGGDKDG